MAIQTYTTNIDSFDWGTLPHITKAGAQIDDTNDAAIIAAVHAEPPYVSVYKNGALLATGQEAPAAAGGGPAQGPFSGRATLVAGTVTVNTSAAVPGVNIILSRQGAGGTLGDLSVGTIVPGVSFVINSNSAADTSVVYWEIRH